MRVAGTSLSMVLLALVSQTQPHEAMAEDAGAVRTILHFSDVHLNVSGDGQTIPFRYNSDATVELLESALTHAQQVLPDPTFFLYSGDHAVHGRYSDAQLALAVDTNVAVIEKYYPPKSDVMLEATAIIGNADGNPDYYMEVTNPEKHVNPSIAKISGAWNASLSESDLDTFNHKGYLSYELDENLVVLTLNTVPYSPNHLPDTSDDEDPFGQFEWLDTTLSDLQQRSKFAYITGHIPPFVDSYGGDPQWHVHYIESYKQIVASYTDVIKAQLFGHVHSVEFRIPVASADAAGYDSTAQLVPLFVTGSISPLFGNNPSFMVWEFNNDTYELLDFTVYASNISEADQSLNWKPLFRATEAYGLESLSTPNLRALYQEMQSNSSLLDAYYWNMKARSYRQPPCSNVVCRAKTLCTMKWWTTKGEFLACVDSMRTIMAAGTTATEVSSATKPQQQTGISSADIFWTMSMTVATVAVVSVWVVVVMRFVKNSGVLKTQEAREKEYENIFPML